MAQLAYEMAKLTTKSKHIDGMGFGGTQSDKLVVAGALGMRNPENNKKLSKEAELLVRYAYAFDDTCRKSLCATLFLIFRAKPTKLEDETLLALCRVSLVTYKHSLVTYDKTRKEQVNFRLNNSQLGALINVNRKNVTHAHTDMLDAIYQQLCIWESDASYHLNQALKEA
jgi:hypothetical protein